MSGEIEVRQGNELALPTTGELIPLDDPVACATAYEELKRLEARIAQAKRDLAQAAGAAATEQGTRTIRLKGGLVARVTGGEGGEETVYDAERIEELLREAELPEDAIRQVVREEVSHKVMVREAKKVAAAHPKFKAAIDAGTSTVEKPYGIEIRKA